MSGFGGFGSNPPPFGSQPPQQQQPFGTTAPPSQPFGSIPQQGSFAAPVAPFGSAAPPPTSNPFGAAAPSGVPSFGTSNNLMSQSSSAAAGAFGQPAPQITPANTGMTFGASPNLAPGGSLPQTGGNFPNSGGPFGNSAFPSGQSNAFGNNSSGFGSNSMAAQSSFPTSSSQPQQHFGMSPPARQQPAASNPFAPATTGAPPMSFGHSSNLISSGMGSNSTSNRNSMGFSSTPTKPQMSGANPFGRSQQLATSSSDMADDAPARSNLPFGTPVSQGASGSRQRDNSSKPQPTQEELFARLKAKKEKLRRLQEEKKKGASRESTLNPQATSFEPAASSSSSSRNNRSSASATSRSSAMSSQERTSAAEKNAIRFATNTNQATRSLMPKDLIVQEGASNYASLRVEGRGDREDLDKAVALVGTCPYYCPDEELLRRERESDIQLLETPLPGKLHPADWTLRDTVVKRFRRSAADYKLDVPEWVRPPDVLEQVCGYLEEWVMERDRQGSDPRFPNGGTPPPLDVYQFIWDRTRMIRKDYTLQNYVGTGGNCDARAVRCHERICRWHAMCEHQLSHLPDFVNMQSQQNVQELGQTMKTLNQFYDDSLNRSTVEVPAADGTETRTDLSAYAYGCKAGIVQGANPVDYDGTPIVNETEPGRLIQPGVTNRAGRHGTAEPEMRGLYILLTIDNDGGMEVLKYAARLYRNRPSIYHSPPVQLALAVYKAKKEYNYARFFSILRDPSTPYLFSCIMFKYVETMRKVAFRIFSKTYGGRSKGTNEAIYDSYPLKTLAKVLCFEDLDEARNACQHYNISVKERQVGSPGGERREEMIHWRRTPFKEPRDPSKNTIILLKPRKMVRTIESKLRGASRLAVCRGGVSGDASFSSPPVPSVQGVSNQAGQPLGNDSLEQSRVHSVNREMEQAATEMRLKKEALRREKEKEEERQTRLQSQLRARKEAVKLRRAKEEEEKARQLKEKQELLQKKAAEERAAEEAKRAEAARQAEETRRREEAKRRKLEEIKERERLARLEEERQLREREERRRVEEERRRRQEIEAERLRLELEKKRAEEERVRKEKAERDAKEAEALENHRKWKSHVDRARREVTWHRWLQRFPRRLDLLEETSLTMSQITGVKRKPIVDIFSILDDTPKQRPVAQVLNLNHLFVSLMSTDNSYSLNSPLTKFVESQRLFIGKPPFSDDGGDTAQRKTFLFKVAVLFPESLCPLSTRSTSELIQTWLKFTLQFDYIHNVEVNNVHVRVVFVDGTAVTTRSNADAVLLAGIAGAGVTAGTMHLSELGIPGDCIPDGVPVSAFLLTETPENTSGLKRNFGYGRSSTRVEVVCVKASKSEIMQGLTRCIDTVFRGLSLDSAKLVESLSIFRLCSICVKQVLWQGLSVESQCGVLDVSNRVLFHLREALLQYSSVDANISWPAAEFASRSGVVKDYFQAGVDLPMNWQSSVENVRTRNSVIELASLFDGTLSLPAVISTLVASAPLAVQHECTSLLDRRLFRRCLQAAMQWRELNDDSLDGCTFNLYMPTGSFQSMIECALSRSREYCLDIQKRHSNGKPDQLIVARKRGERTDDDRPTPFLPNTLHPTPRALCEDRSSSPPRRGDLVSVDDQPDKKRQRTTSQTETEASAAFTSKLEAILRGDPATDKIIGRSSLSNLLRRKFK